MNKRIKLVITILFGYLGVHKFIEKKKSIGFLYMFTFGLLGFGWMIDIVGQVQAIKNIDNEKINKTRRVLALVSAGFFFLMALGNIGAEESGFSGFLLFFFVATCILKIHHFCGELNYYDDEAIFNNAEGVDNKHSIYTEASIPVITNKENDKKISNGLLGTFYNEEILINGKYRNIETPKYILIQLREKLSRSGSIYLEDGFIRETKKYKNLYLDKADFYPFNTYYPSFSNMNKYQIKWYLYWRKQFLNGNILDTDISYIFLFAYELINYTFNSKASFNISVLEKLYESYKTLYPKLENYLPIWKRDLLSETTYFENNDAEEIIDDTLVNMLSSGNELEKINISVWKKHYTERKSDLTNKQVSLIYGNQKFYNRFKKYAGLLAQYYIDDNINITDKWFSIKDITEKRVLFVGAISSLERRQGTFKCKKFFANEKFYHDMNQITKLSYDLVFPQKGMKEEEYVINQFNEGKYELPQNYFFKHFKVKGNKINFTTENALPLKKDNNFSIDFDKIDNINTAINYVGKQSESLALDDVDKNFITLFKDNLLLKSEAKKHCIQMGKMLNAHVSYLNEKYYPIIGKELIIEDGENLILNVNKEVL